MKKSVLSLVVTAFIAAPASLWAIPAVGDLYVDFRTADWSGANGQTSWTVGNVTANALPQGEELYQDSTDGLGILGGVENDEIDMLEVLEIVFGGNSGVGLTGAWLTDIYAASSLQGLPEQGTVTLELSGGGSQAFNFTGTGIYTLGDPTDNGELYIDFLQPYSVTKATFVTLGHLNDFDDDDSDYSVAGFTRVPDGGLTLSLLAMALTSLGVLRRGRK